MLDEIRKNHDPRPTAEERAWMEADRFSTAHVIAAAVLALMVALSLSLPNGEAMATAIPASTNSLTTTANGSADIQARSCALGFGS